MPMLSAFSTTSAGNYTGSLSESAKNSDPIAGGGSVAVPNGTRDELAGR